MLGLLINVAQRKREEKIRNERIFLVVLSLKSVSCNRCAPIIILGQTHDLAGRMGSAKSKASKSMRALESMDMIQSIEIFFYCACSSESIARIAHSFEVREIYYTPVRHFWLIS